MLKKLLQKLFCVKHDWRHKEISGFAGLECAKCKTAYRVTFPSLTKLFPRPFLYHNETLPETRDVRFENCEHRMIDEWAKLYGVDVSGLSIEEKRKKFIQRHIEFKSEESC